MINKIFRSYVELPRNIILLFGVELCLSLVHVAFILILNIYLRKVGYSDPDIAAFNSLRFIGALAFSLPLGIYIRGKKLKRFFIFSSFLVPIISIVLIESISSKISPLIQVSFLTWGIAMMFLRVCSLPFIIRQTTDVNSSEALSLNAATWSLATIISGLIISGLDWLSVINIYNTQIMLSERTILWIITFISAFSIPIVLKIKEPAMLINDLNYNQLSFNKAYDWNLIFQAISPLILISIGAGLTIPFVNLFFNSVFRFSSSDFSIMGSVTAIFVFFSSLMVPTLKKKYGYWMTIVLVQGLSICCLIILALTELFSDYYYVIYIAISAYVLRQPLMHMAHPSSNELMMNFVGKRNQELISALSSSLWSASWFISAKIFEWLRILNFYYYEIFLITAGLYIIGVFLYVLIIRKYENLQKEKSVECSVPEELRID
ncbi:MAG: hypothetical protein CMG55_09830 [Candidatus Marinimicrobia bacterium]|nr:hypothetical protein [Candidatus Neomarinimicrobiota bacterium]|tara:strand:+ start:411 stop:1712 length:1302 start_codon:yes stop_codon:yes gene_type:complete